MMTKASKDFLYLQILSTLLISTSFLLVNAQHKFLSSLFGGFIGTLNWMVLSWIWGRVFHKKSIALTLLAVVFKYAILIALIFSTITKGKVDVIGFLAGLSGFLPAALVYATIAGLDVTEVEKS